MKILERKKKPDMLIIDNPCDCKAADKHDRLLVDSEKNEKKYVLIIDWFFLRQPNHDRLQKN
jgi:hypothetical protein